MAYSKTTLAALLLASLAVTGCDNSEPKEQVEPVEQAESSAPQTAPEAIPEDLDAAGFMAATEIDFKTLAPTAVVARVAGEPITAQEVAALMQYVPADVQHMPPGILFLAMRDQLIDMKLVKEEANRQSEKLAQRPDVQEALEKAREQVLMEAYLRTLVEDDLTDAALENEYKNLVAKFPAGMEEVKVHHIVVPTVQEAKDILEELEAGVDFLKLAREKSVDPRTADQDGEIPGYLSPLQQSVLPLGYSVLFKKTDGKEALPTGTYTKTPIEVPGGYALVKVMERRLFKAPKFQEVKDMLRTELRSKMLEKHMQALRNTAEIARFHPNTGQPMKSLESQVEKLQKKLATYGESQAAQEMKSAVEQKEPAAQN